MKINTLPVKMSWFKNILSAKAEPFNFGEFHTDIHSHLIPGIDDGSQNMEETIGLLHKMSSMGYRRVITTPHIMSDYYQNDASTILGGLELVRDEINKLNIPIEIDAAAEYYYDEFLFQKIANKELLTFGDHYVLFEFSFTAKPKSIDELIFTFKTSNYKPILAHFERYPYFFDNGIEVAQGFRDKGVLLQLNLTSLSGHYGKHVKAQAEQLVDHGLVDVVGTDCHRMDHLLIMEKNNQNPYLHKLKELNLLNLSV